MTNMYKLIEMLEDGLIDPTQTALNLILWIGEDECEKYIKVYDIESEEE